MLRNCEVKYKRGKRGHKGDAGSVGPTGPDGNDGPTGPTGASGNNGSIGPTGTSGNRGNTGQSVKGTTGPTGAAGNNGNLGEMGATGPDGNVGPTGPAFGTTGPVGIQGDSSTLLGPTGPAGNTGPVGPVGSTGATGDTGDVGATGICCSPTGPAGLNSNINGPTGPTGAPGSAGPVGFGVYPNGVIAKTDPIPFSYKTSTPADGTPVPLLTFPIENNHSYLVSFWLSGTLVELQSNGAISAPPFLGSISKKGVVNIIGTTANIFLEYNNFNTSTDDVHPIPSDAVLSTFFLGNIFFLNVAYPVSFVDFRSQINWTITYLIVDASI
jgi:hypothetical protein